MARVFGPPSNDCGGAAVCLKSRRFLFWVLLFFGVGCIGRDSAAVELPQFLTGAAFQRGAARQVKIVWRNAPLRDALETLQAQTRLAIWLDRRLDPGQAIDFSAEDEPIKQLLPRLAKQIGGGAVMLDSVFYFGPAETAAVLQDVLQKRKQELRRLPLEAQRKLAKKTANQWPDLTTPREILEALQAKRGIRLKGEQEIPHDLWARRRLPPLGLIDQLQLILSGFNSTFRFADGGKQLVLTPLALP